jgi:hypothetical protein
MIPPIAVMVDPTVAADILVAVGTMALAGTSYLSIRDNRKQLKLLTEEFKMSKSERAPILKLDEIKFEGNRLSLSVQNIGGGPAIWLGLRTSFIPAKQTFLDKQNGSPLNPAQLQEEARQKVRLSWRYDMIHPRPTLVHESEKVGWEELVMFLPNPTTNDPTLFPNEKQTFSLEPHFLITAHKIFLGAPFSYDQLKILLTTNHVGYAALMLGLVAKDTTDREVAGGLSERLLRTSRNTTP